MQPAQQTLRDQGPSDKQNKRGRVPARPRIISPQTAIYRKPEDDVDEDNDSYKAALARANRRAERKEAEVTELKKEVAEQTRVTTYIILNSDAKQWEMRTEIGTLNAQLETANMEVRCLKQELAQARSAEERSDQPEEKQDALHAALVLPVNGPEQKRQEDHLREEVAGLRATTAAQDLELTALRAEMAALRKALVDNRAREKELVGEVAGLRAQNSGLEDEYMKRCERIRELIKENGNIRGEIVASQSSTGSSSTV